MTASARLVGHPDGIPIYRYRTDRDVAAVSVHRVDANIAGVTPR
ncbi:hypothetical protein [Mycobacterium genavense]|nr:hypothetical protein [Mycobacterium genavense]